MRIAAGIAGILLGMFSLAYVGIYGSMVGSAAGLLGAIPFQGNTLGSWAETVKVLSWLAPLATIVGGIVTFSKPSVGGLILGVSALLHWHLLGFGQAGKLFVLPIGATAVLALFARSSTRSEADLVVAQLHRDPVDASPANMSATATATTTTRTTIGPTFDRAKWEALLKYDDDVASVAEKLRPLGPKWLDEFASSYLALNDKQYISSIEQKIVAAASAAAKAEAERQEQALIRVRQQEEAERLERERLDMLKHQPREKVPLAVLAVVAAGVAVAGIAIGLIAWPQKSAETTIDSQRVMSQSASPRTVAQPQAATPQPAVGSPQGASTYPYCTVEQLRNAERLKNAHGCPKQSSIQSEAPVWTINAAQDIANEFRRRGCPNVEADLANAICNSVDFSCWSANTRQTTIAVKQVCNDIYVTLADSNGVQTENRHYRLEQNTTSQPHKTRVLAETYIRKREEITENYERRFRDGKATSEDVRKLHADIYAALEPATKQQLEGTKNDFFVLYNKLAESAPSEKLSLHYWKKAYEYIPDPIIKSNIQYLEKKIASK